MADGRAPTPDAPDAAPPAPGLCPLPLPHLYLEGSLWSGPQADVHGILESCAQAAVAVATPVPGKIFAPSKPLNAHFVRNNPSLNLQVIVK